MTNILAPQVRRLSPWVIPSVIVSVLVGLLFIYYFALQSHQRKPIMQTISNGTSSREPVAAKPEAPKAPQAQVSVDPWGPLKLEQEKKLFATAWEEYFAQRSLSFEQQQKRRTTSFENELKLAETRRSEWMNALRAPGLVDVQTKGGGTSSQETAQTGMSNLQSSALSPSYLVEPQSPYRLNAGTHIPITIDQWMSSDATGGQWIGHVSVDILDSLNSRHILIPAGTVATGVGLPNMENNEQPVLNLVMTLLQIPPDKNRPNGAFLELPPTAGQNTLGLQGLNGDVNHHRVQKWGSAIVLSLISAGIRMAAYSGGGYGGSHGDGYYLSPADAAAQGFGQGIGEVLNAELQKKMSIKPTVNVPLGYNFTMTLQKIQEFDKPFVR